MSADLATCHICGTSIPCESYDAHVDSCTSSRVQCPICTGMFDVASIEAHASTCDGTAPRGDSAPPRRPFPTPATGGGGGEPSPARDARHVGAVGAVAGMCRGGCGFHGNDMYGGYCSACFKRQGGGPAVEAPYVPGAAPATKSTYNAGNGRTIKIRMGDITLEDADIVVNPANKKLDHASGVAGAIRRAGGPIIQDTCDIWRHENGDLPTGKALLGVSGELKCKHIIHTVGPIWNKDSFEDQERNKQELFDAVTNTIIEAEKVKATSIAMPAISSGIFGFPRPLCARILFSAVATYWQENTTSCVTEMRFTNVDKPTVDVFLGMFPGAETTLTRTLTNNRVVRTVRGDQSHFFFGAHIRDKIVMDCTSAKNPKVHHGSHELITNAINASLRGQIDNQKRMARTSDDADVLKHLSSFVIMSPHTVVLTVPMFDVSEDSIKKLRAAVARGLVRASTQLPDFRREEDGTGGGTITIPLLGSRSGFSNNICAQIVIEEVLNFLMGPSSENIREVALCEDHFSQTYLEMLKNAIDVETGNPKPLPEIVLPKLDGTSAAPADETPAQRRERERAMAQARLQMELAQQTNPFE